MSTYETAVPGSDVYAQAELAAKTGYQNAVAKYNNQRLDTLQQAGYLADIDPTSGTLANLRVDPNNPYGTYQSLLRGGAQQSEAAHANAASRGIGGGLARQGETEAKYQFGAGSFQLGTGLQNTLHGYDVAQTGAETDMNNSITQSKLSALQAALQAQLNGSLQSNADAVNALANRPININLSGLGGDGGGGGSVQADPGTYQPPAYGPAAGYTPAGTPGQDAQGNAIITAPGNAGIYRNAGGTVTYQSKSGNRKVLQ